MTTKKEVNERPELPSLIQLKSMARSLGLDTEVLYPLDFSKIVYYKISLDEVVPGCTWEGECYPPSWKGIKVESVYSPPSKEVTDRELKKIQDNPLPLAQKLRDHLIGICDNTTPFIRERHYTSLKKFSFDCMREFVCFKETEKGSLVDRLRLFVRLVNSSKEYQTLFQKTVGALCIGQHHIHHYQDGSCELHQTTDDHNHEWLFKFGQYLATNTESVTSESLFVQDRFFQGELETDSYSRSPRPDLFPPDYYWVESVKQVYWCEMPSIDSSRLIDHFRLRYDADSRPNISIYYCKKRQEMKNCQESEVIDYFPTPINFTGFVSLIVKVMFFQQKYTYQIIPDHPAIGLDDWSPKEDWVPYPAPKKKKVSDIDYGEKALKEFVRDINENSYIRNIFKDLSFTIQFDLVEELNDIRLKKFLHYHLIYKSDGSCEYYEGLTLDDNQNPSYDFKCTTTLRELHRILSQYDLSDHKDLRPDHKNLVRNINWEYESHEGIVHESHNRIDVGGEKMIQWVFALRKYCEIKKLEVVHYSQTYHTLKPPPGFIPMHSVYWFSLSKKIKHHPTCRFHSVSCLLESHCWGYVKDFPLIEFLIENGKEISEEEFRGKSRNTPYLPSSKSPPHFYQYKNIFWCNNELEISIFSLEKDIFNLAQEHCFNPLPLWRMPSYFTLEYYGFAPSGGWDESVSELSRKYWYGKFRDSEFYYSWAYYNKFKEMNPVGVGYRYAQRELGEKSSLLTQ